MNGRHVSVQIKAPVRFTSMNFLKDSRRCATEDVSPVERNAEHVSPSGAYPALLILRLPR
jgi:hypothetical protein